MQDHNNEPLTFVENTDLSSALSRNRRDKIHVSCKLCRARKVRCSGQASGCDRCKGIGAICNYPTPEARRKKLMTGHKTNASISSIESSKRTSCNNCNNQSASGNHWLDWGRGYTKGEPPALEAGDEQISDKNLGMIDFDVDYGKNFDNDRLPFLEYRLAQSFPSTGSIKSYGKDAQQHSKHLLSSPDIADGQATNQCSCLHLTACLLEELSANSASNDSAAMDVLLSYFRGTIARCSTVVNCDQCTSAGESNMLLVMAGQYMSTICERIVMCYVTMQKTLGKRRRPSSPKWSCDGLDTGRVTGAGDDVGSGLFNSSEDMWFSTYHIGSSYERLQVLRCIISVQMTEFWRLLEKFKWRAGNRKGHLVLLTEAETQTRKSRAMLKQSINRPTTDTT